MINKKDKIVEAYNYDEVVKDYVLFSEKYGLCAYENVVAEKFFKAGETLLDIGCGCGRTTAPFAKMGFKVVGVDISAKMIQTAKQTYPHIDFRVCDARNMNEFADNTFDNAFFSLNGIALLNANDKKLCIKEIHRVLKNGGIFAFTVPCLTQNSPRVQNAIAAKTLDISNYNSRLKLGEVTHNESGTLIKLHLPFEIDLLNLLNHCGFCIIFAALNNQLAPLEQGINKTAVFVCKKPEL